jgi:N-formylmaleamate deformylase
MPSWQSGFVESNGIRVHYTRTGGAKPPLVLAHGFSDDGLCWTPVAEALAPDYDVIMVDARGHGRSEGPEEGYTPAELAEDLAGVISALGLERPAVLGHSMGAATTMGLAGARPDLVGKILLEDPPAGWMPASDPPPGNTEWQNRMRQWIVELKRKTRDEMIAEGRARSPGWSDAELGPWADSKLRLSFNVLNRGAAKPNEWVTVLRRISAPALLITGDAERGALVSPEAAAALTELVPQLRVVHIPEAGHSIRRDQPGAYLEVVRSFLA